MHLSVHFQSNLGVSGGSCERFYTLDSAYREATLTSKNSRKNSRIFQRLRKTLEKTLEIFRTKTLESLEKTLEKKGLTLISRQRL